MSGTTINRSYADYQRAKSVKLQKIIEKENSVEGVAYTIATSIFGLAIAAAGAYGLTTLDYSSLGAFNQHAVGQVLLGAACTTAIIYGVSTALSPAYSAHQRRKKLSEEHLRDISSKLRSVRNYQELKEVFKYKKFESLEWVEMGLMSKDLRDTIAKNLRKFEHPFIYERRMDFGQLKAMIMKNVSDPSVYQPQPNQ